MSDDDTRSSEDFSEDEIEEDDEATMAEEEQLDENINAADELRMLNEENEMSIEDLRRLYGYGDNGAAANNNHADPDQPSSSSAAAATASAGPSASADPVKNYFGDDALDEEDDEDYVPKAAEYWKRSIRVGEEYQVGSPLPEVKEPADAATKYEAVPLWKPVDDDDAKLRQFLVQVMTTLHEKESNGCIDQTPQANRPPKCPAFADDEDALYALYKNGYDVEATLKEVPFPPANGPHLSAPNVWKAMTTEEVDRFEKAFREHGKNFVSIRENEMTDRTVGELVFFYYIWKKTERHDMFVEANRALGLQIGSDGKTVDPMDLLADQQLNEVNGTGATVVPSVLNTHTTPPKAWLSVQNHPTPSACPKPSTEP